MKKFFTSVRNAHIIVDLALLLLVSCIPLVWIPNGFILTGHDSGYPINVLETFKNRFYAWNAQDNFGVDNTTSISALFVHTVEAVASFMGADVRTAENFTFVFWFFMMHLAMYVLARSLRDVFSFRWFPLLAALLYAINFYLLALWRYGAGTTFSAYSCLPLFTAVVLAFMRGKKTPLEAALLASVILFFFNGGGGVSIPLFGGLLATLFWAIVYFTWLTPKNDRLRFIKKLLLFGGFTGLFSFLLNAYWLLPFGYYAIVNYSQAIANSGGKVAVLVWTQAVSTYTSIHNLLRLQGFPDWYNNPTHPYANRFLTQPVLVLMSMLLAPLAYVSVAFTKERNQIKILLFFFGLSLFGVFLSAGLHEPTGWLYGKLMLYIPGFVIFRSAQYKFIPALYLAFAILIAYTLSVIIEKISSHIRIKRLSRSFVSALCAVMIMLLVVGYHYPYFRKGFFLYTSTLSTLLKVPDYVLSFDTWSRDHMSDEGRMMMLPRYHSAWKAALYDWNYFSLYSLFNLLRAKPFTNYSYYLNDSQFALMDRLFDEVLTNGTQASHLHKLFGHTHLLLALDTKFNAGDMAGENPTLYQAPVSTNPAYALEWNEGKWQLFSVKNADAQKQVYGISGLTRFEGQGKDVVGAVLAGSNNFYLPTVFGKSFKNAQTHEVPTNAAIHAASCASCVLNREVELLTIPPNTLIPGSLFYKIKTWKERKLRDATVPIDEQVTNTLGLTLKRTAELDSMFDQLASPSRIEPVVATLSQHWQFIDDSLRTRYIPQRKFDRTIFIEKYLVAERKIFKRSISRASTNELKQTLINLEAQVAKTQEIITQMRSQFDRVRMYTVKESLEQSTLFMDLYAIEKTAIDTMVLPNAVIVGDQRFPIRPTIADERVNLGSFNLSGVASVRVEFPQAQSVLYSHNVHTNAEDPSGGVCETASVAHFWRSKKYLMHVRNARSLPRSVQIFIVKDRHEGLPPVVTPISFDRTVDTAQPVFMSWTDGDVGMYVKLCTASDEQMARIADFVEVFEYAEPTLFIVPQNSQLASPVTTIEYDRIDQTKYRIKGSSIKEPMVLVFNQNFNTGWKIYTKKSGTATYAWDTWFQGSWKSAKQLEIFGYANAWYIRDVPQDDLIIEFYPQALFYQGIVVTVIGAVGLVLFVVYRRNRKK